jgi:3-hydroxyacyl-CoA dehydrogenase / 3-hydroxy-2-methylbutyryl-CoA dehydrogenase
MQLKDKVVVITGGASGLGKCATEFLVREKGCKVGVFDINDAAGAGLAVELGTDNAIYCNVDVSNEEWILFGVHTVLEKFGAIHVCVNGAGIPAPVKILDQEGRPSSYEIFREAIMVNLVGSFNMMAYCAAEMAKNLPNEDGERGVVINIASIAAFEGQVGQTAYASSKSGVVGMTLPAARELADLGIRVNTIAPGIFMTAMVESVGNRVIASWEKMIEYPRRFGSSDEFSSLVAYICENSYLNGECIRLDAATRLRSK